MKVSATKMAHVYRQVQTAKEHMSTYALSNGALKLSVEDLRWCIEDMLGISIEVHEVSFDADHVRGMVERYADRAVIYVRADQSSDYKRYVCTKELCHLLIDQPDDLSILGTKTIEDLLVYGSPSSAEIAPPPAQSEKFAELAALELMYPFEFRQADAKKLEEKKITAKKIALEHEIPEFVVDRGVRPDVIAMAKKFMKD